MIELSTAGVAVTFGRVCRGVVIDGVVIDTLDIAMLAVYAVNVFDNITLEFDTDMVVVDDAVAVILRLKDETTDVLDTAIAVKVAIEFLDDAIPVTVLETVAATLLIPVWFR